MFSMIWFILTYRFYPVSWGSSFQVNTNSHAMSCKAFHDVAFCPFSGASPAVSPGTCSDSAPLALFIAPCLPGNLHLKVGHSLHCFLWLKHSSPSMDLIDSLHLLIKYHLLIRPTFFWVLMCHPSSSHPCTPDPLNHSTFFCPWCLLPSNTQWSSLM